MRTGVIRFCFVLLFFLSNFRNCFQVLFVVVFGSDAFEIK